ncbi:MAG: hypothetical protein GW823_12125 [Bacteroidetes bacterium]|nr:hypothetical protein [Bacteroidota bacterium]
MTIVIKGKSTPVLIKIILAIFLVICILMPIGATIFSFGESGLHIGIVFSFILFWGIGFYLLRVILWNTFGQETLLLNTKKILYLADYKYFKDGKREIGIKNLTIKIIYENQKNKTVGRLFLFNETEQLETVLQTNILVLIEIVNKIKAHYNL